MSTDFDAVCHRCRKSVHAGQIMAATPSFGYGSGDLKGSLKVAAFVMEHASECGSVLIVNADDSSPCFDREDDEDGEEVAESPSTTRFAQGAVLRSGCSVKMGAPLTVDGIQIGVATHPSTPDPNHPGYHLVRVAIGISEQENSK